MLGHLRRCAAFVDKDEPLGIKLGLSLEPGLAHRPYVWPFLLGCMRGLFYA